MFKMTKLVRRSWRANGPKRRATSALKTTAVSVKRAIAALTLRLESWVDLGTDSDVLMITGYHLVNKLSKMCPKWNLGGNSFIPKF